ncbi:MAG: carboxylating nicotinate-nucleotide diphosphorylase [Oscillospiraceae bacterium]|jgi:nicotinate-nucleotide pyrophosphorylase (carboxylating)|nr:carboxylating nicotinate-nucleotide diphosphorylase [Oscillospiraceae bacterium]
MNLPAFYIDDLIKTALAEDISYIDLTTDLLISEDSISRAFFLSKADGVLAGLDAACRVMELTDREVKVTKHFRDGARIKPGDIIAEFSGKTAALLKAERTSLNLLQHMSGIATCTAECAEKIADTKARITDTRKTLPGLRSLQKYAVLCGGGFNHRYNLSDAALIKNNHIDACGSITEAVKILRSRLGHMANIEVEVRNFAELNQALEAGVKIILLDNMNVSDMAEAVKISSGRAILEASGNITLGNIRETALTGVDIISMGALTHCVKALDISLRFK